MSRGSAASARPLESEASDTARDWDSESIFEAAREPAGRAEARTATERARTLARVTRAGRARVGLNAMAAMVTAETTDGGRK